MTFQSTIADSSSCCHRCCLRMGCRRKKHKEYDTNDNGKSKSNKKSSSYDWQFPVFIIVVFFMLGSNYLFTPETIRSSYNSASTYLTHYNDNDLNQQNFITNYVTKMDNDDQATGFTFTDIRFSQISDSRDRNNKWKTKSGSRSIIGMGTTNSMDNSKDGSINGNNNGNGNGGSINDVSNGTYKMVVWFGHHKGGSTPLYEMCRDMNWKLEGYKDGYYVDEKSLRPRFEFGNFSFVGYYRHWIKEDKNGCKNYLINRMDYYNYMVDNDDENSKKIKFKLFMVHLLRNPLSVLLSTHFYHSQTSYIEAWLWEPLSTFCIYLDNGAKTRINKLAATFENGKYANIMDANKDTSLTDFYQIIKRVDLSFALYVTFEYFNCAEWPQIQTLYHLKLTNLINYNLIQKYGIQMEVYNVKFEYLWKWADLDQFEKMSENNHKIIENMQSLYNFNNTMSNVIDISLPYHLDSVDYKVIKESLMNRYQFYDANKKDNSIEPYGLDHATSGTYNRTKAIDKLLGNKFVCNNMKNKHIELDYFWLFPQYC